MLPGRPCTLEGCLWSPVDPSPCSPATGREKMPWQMTGDCWDMTSQGSLQVQSSLERLPYHLPLFGFGSSLSSSTTIGASCSAAAAPAKIRMGNKTLARYDTVGQRAAHKLSSRCSRSHCRLCSYLALRLGWHSRPLWWPRSWPMTHAQTISMDDTQY